MQLIKNLEEIVHLRKNRGSRQVAILPTMAPKTPLLCPVQAQSPSASPVPSALPSQEPIPESSTEPPAPSLTPSCARSHLVSEPPCRRSLRALLQAPVFHLLPRKRAPSRLRNLRKNQVSRQVTILPTVAPKTTIRPQRRPVLPSESCSRPQCLTVPGTEL